MPTYLPSGIRDELGALQFSNKSADDLAALDWEQRSLDDIGRIAPARAFSTPDAPVYEAPGQIQLSGPRRPAQPEQAPDWRPLNAQIAEQARQMNQQTTGGQAAPGTDPTTMSDRSQAAAAPAAASGVPQAMPSGGMSDEAWARREALRLGIDPQKAVDVGNTEGGFTQPGRQNMQGAPAYSSYQLYIGGPNNPGLGDEALAAGIDPRDPAQSKRAITYALEHAARNGWGAFQGAAANGIGNWDGIGGRPASSPTAAAPSAAAPSSSPAADSSRSAAGGWEVDQAALDDPDKWSLCGPVAAVMAATRRGGQWTVAQAKKIATESGLWNVNQGMGGLQTEVSLLNKLGVAAQTGAADLQHLTSDALAGNTPIISTVKHYFILKGYDPETGRFDTTTSGSVLPGGSRWLTLDQIEKLGDGIQGAAYIDNPSSPISSAVAGASDAYKLADTQTAPATGGLSPGDQKRQKMGLSGPEQMPGTISGPSDNATDPTMPSDYGSSLRTPGPLPIERQPDHINDVNTEIRDRLNQQMYRQPLQATTGPDSTVGADPSSSYNDPTADGTLGQPLPSYTGDGFPDPSGGGTSAPGVPSPSSSPSPDRPSPANDPGAAQPQRYDPYGGSSDPTADATRSVQPDTSPTSPTSTQVPVWDESGQEIVGYRHVPAAQRQNQQRQADGYGQVQSTPGEPDYVPSPPNRVEQALAPAADVYGRATDVVNQQEDAAHQRNEEVITSQIGQQITAPVEAIRRGVRLATAIVQATPEATSETVNAALDAMGMGRDTYGVSTPLGRVGIGDAVLALLPNDKVQAVMTAGMPIAHGRAGGTDILERGANAAVGAARDLFQSAGRGIRALTGDAESAIARTADALPALPDGYVRVVHLTRPEAAQSIAQTGLDYSMHRHLPDTAITFQRAEDVSSAVPYGADPSKVAVVMDIPKSERALHDAQAADGTVRSHAEMPGRIDPKYVVGIVPTSELDRAGELARQSQSRGIGSRIRGALDGGAERVAAADAPFTATQAAATGNQRPVLTTEAEAIVNYLAGRYPNLDNPDIVNAIAGQPVDRARRLLRSSWVGSGNRGSVNDFHAAVDEAMVVGEREARGRVHDPAIERAGYGKRQGGGHADLSGLAETSDQLHNTDILSQERQPIPTARDDAPRGGSISRNAVPGGWATVDAGPGLAERAAQINLPPRIAAGRAIGAVTGATAGAASAPDDATWDERTARALAGGSLGFMAGGHIAAQGTMGAARLIDSLIARGKLNPEILLDHPEPVTRIKALFGLAAEGLPDNAPVRVPGMAQFIARLHPDQAAELGPLLSGQATAGEVRQIVQRSLGQRFGQTVSEIVTEAVTGMGARGQRAAETRADTATIRGLPDRLQGVQDARPQSAMTTVPTHFGRATETTDPEITGMVGQVARDLGIEPPRVFVAPSNEVNAAVMSGPKVKPIMILTKGLGDANLTPEEMRALLTHELSHAAENQSGAATFGASPNYRPPTPAQIKAAEVQGARRGEMLNREVKPPGSSVPLGARLSTALTDPLAATRYAENLLTDTAGVPRLPDNSPLRASTLLRENPTGFIKDRIETELAAPVIEAAQKGLQTELPRYVEDTHQRDILDKFYGRGHQEAIDAGEQAAAEAVDRVDKVVKQRLEHAERQAKAAVDDVESVAKQRVADAEQGAKDHLAKADLIVRERVNAAEKQATALERRGFQSQADTVRRNAETNASQVMTRAQERADAIRERAQASAQPDALARAQERATEIRRQAQDNASQTMTRTQEQADKLKATPEQADAAGTLAMRQRQGSNPEHTYEATNARLLEQEQRLTASGTFGDLQSLAQQIWDASQKTLDNSVAAGRVEPQVAADLKAMYPHYVPTVPISKLDPGGRSFGASSGGTTVGASKTNPIHALEDVGASSERLNPIVAVRNQIVTQERQNHQNQVFQAFAQLMDNAGVPTPGAMGKKPNLWEGERQISGRINGQPETRMVPASVANGIESMTQAGMGADAAVNVYKRVVGWFAGQLTAARASYIPLNLARDAGDTFFNTMVKNGGPARLPRVMGMWLDEASRAVADVAAAQATPRGLLGAAGGFAYGATQVDDQNAPISTRLLHGAEAAIPGAFLLGANKNVNVSSRAANEFIARGGASGGISSGWRPGQRWYRDVLRDGGTPIKNAQDMALFMRDWAGDVWNLQGLKGANERLDLVGRTTAMRVAEARGAGPTEAMIAGRDSSYDPDKAGTILRAVNGMIPFTNATVQGGAQFARALRDHPGTTLATVAATLAPVMLGVEAWNRSDPQRAQIYDNVPQYLKDSGIIWVPPHEWSQGSDTRGILPKYLWFPTEITTPFVIGMRAAMQHLDTVVPGLQPSAGRSDVNPDAPEWQKWLGVLNEAVQIFNPTHGDTAAAIASGAVPPVIKQTMELGLNKDLYRGNAIMSDPADERASALSQGISRTANDLGNTFNSPFLQNVRPSGVEHILRADPAHYDIASGISDQVKPSPYKAAEQGRIANEPFVGGIASRFIRDTGGADLERAQGQTLNQQVQAILQSARMRPSEADLTVPADYKGANLTRDEMVRWQQQANIEIQSGITDALDSKQWDDPMTRSQAVKDAISKAKERAAKDALGLTPRDIKDRIEQQSILQRQAVGAR